MTCLIRLNCLSYLSCLRIFALVLLAVSLPAQAAHPPKDEIKQLRALRDAGDIAAVEAALSSLHERYRRGEIDDEVESRTIAAIVSTDPGPAAFYAKWVAAYPQSYMARTVLGRFHVEAGFDARGAAWASETSRQQMDGMQRLHAQARVELESALALTDKPVSALAELVQVNMTIGTPEQMQAAHDQALALDKNAYSPRYFYLRGSQPRWGGSLEAMRSIIDAARNRLSAQQLSTFEILFEDEQHYPAFAAGMALVDLARYQEAAAALTPALAKQPYVRGYISRGNAYSMLKMWDLALADLQKAYAMDPERVCCPGMLGSLAKAQLENKLIAEGMANLIQSAEEDHAWSINTLALVYAFGRHGQKQDMVQAKRWCERAAHLGNSLAMFCLGTLHHSGQGTAKDPEKGVYWLGKAADLGQNDARADLAFILWTGMGVKPDRERAIDLWIAAAKTGHARSDGQLRSRVSDWDYKMKVEYAGFFDHAFPKDGGRAWWLTTLQWLAWGIVMTAMLFWLAWARRRADQSVPAGTLRHPVSTLILGMAGAAFFFGSAIVSTLFPNSTVTLFTDLVFCLSGLLAGLVIIEYFTIKHRFNETGIRHARLLRSNDQFAWKQVTSVRYTRGMGWFVITTTDGKTARISSLMAGLPAFARMVLSQAPKAALDTATQDMLFAMLRKKTPLTSP